MNDGPSLASRFAQLFAGNQHAYGVYAGLQDARDGEKVLGAIRQTLRGEVTLALWEGHLAGGDGLGIIPIREDSNAVFGAIDIDVYAGLDLQDIAALVKRHGLPLLVCRSKSGGAHLYLFAAEPVPAQWIIDRLNEVAAVIGYSGVEVFPKQSHLLQDQTGNFINMPYFNGMAGMRYCIQADGNVLGAGDFLDEACALRQTAAWFRGPLQSPPEAMPHGPPCLQQLIQIGFPAGTRNNGLFNLGVYYKKAAGEDWKREVEQANQRYMSPPLPSDEVAQVLKSVDRKGYNFQCSQPPIAAHCNSRVCRTRKFGISGESEQATLASLTKLKTDPPVYFATLTNGKSVRLTLDELHDPARFQKVCLGSIGCMPKIMKRDQWGALLNEILPNMEEIEAPPEASNSGLIWEFVAAFCTGRLQASSREQILMGKTWTENGRTYFIGKDLFAYLKRNGVPCEMPRLWELLRSHGATNHKDQRINGLKKNLWSVPAFEVQTEGFSLPESLMENERQF